MQNCGLNNKDIEKTITIVTLFYMIFQNVELFFLILWNTFSKLAKFSQSNRNFAIFFYDVIFSELKMKQNKHYDNSPFNLMSKTAARKCWYYKPVAGRQIFADLDRFLGRHAVLSDSVGRHKH